MGDSVFMVREDSEGGLDDSGGGDWSNWRNWKGVADIAGIVGGGVPLGASPRLCFFGAFHGLKAVVIHYWRTSGTPGDRELAAHSDTLALEPTGGVEHDWRTYGTPGRRELAAHSNTLVFLGGMMVVGGEDKILGGQILCQVVDEKMGNVMQTVVQQQ